MKKRQFTQGGKAVMIGWEPVTRTFVMTVHDTRLTEGNRKVYDSDQDLSDGPLDLEHMAAVLGQFGAALPEDVKGTLLRDQAA